MKELEQEKYNLIFNKNINTIKKIYDENRIIYYFSAAYTDNYNIIIKIIFDKYIIHNYKYYIIENNLDYFNNNFKEIKYIDWNYYLEIKIDNYIYRLLDTLDNKKEEEFIIKNFSKEQRKKISKIIFELFKYWLIENSPDIIIRNLTKEKIKIKRYSIIHDYILDNNYYLIINNDDSEVLEYMYIKNQYKGMCLYKSHIFGSYSTTIRKNKFINL